MQSNNPVFRNSEGFNGKAYQGYGDPSTWSTGAGTATVNPHSTGYPTVDEGRMSIDSVVQKTGFTLGLLVVAAAATWVLTGDPTVDEQAASTLTVLTLVGAGGAFLLSMVNSFKRVISPGLVLAFAVLEGVFVGGVSKVYQLYFGPGVVTGAVIGTIAAFAGTLAAYKILNIKVGNKFRIAITAAMFGIVALSLLDFLLGFFGDAIGFNGFGTLGLLMSVAGLVVAIGMLILDFDFVERGVAAGLPERESWRAAFGLTVTLVWIYVNLLRILAIFTGRR